MTLTLHGNTQDLKIQNIKDNSQEIFISRSLLKEIIFSEYINDNTSQWFEMSRHLQRIKITLKTQALHCSNDINCIDDNNTTVIFQFTERIIKLELTMENVVIVLHSYCIYH